MFLKNDVEEGKTQLLSKVTRVTQLSTLKLEKKISFLFSSSLGFKFLKELIQSLSISELLVLDTYRTVLYVKKTNKKHAPSYT